MIKIDLTNINEDEINAALKAAYHIGFSDAAHYMITRNFDDTPVESGFYKTPRVRDLEVRVTACADADHRENIYGDGGVVLNGGKH